jgi:hypothetical protein
MKLDYLDDVDVDYVEPPRGLIRLYDYNSKEILCLINDIENTMLSEKGNLRLDELPYVESINCTLNLRVGHSNLGIFMTDLSKFECEYSISGYKEVIALLKRYITNENMGYNWLTEKGDGIDFLFSAGGEW